MYMILVGFGIILVHRKSITIPVAIHLKSIPPLALKRGGINCLVVRFTKDSVTLTAVLFYLTGGDEMASTV
jgi:hypothetical protein